MHTLLFLLAAVSVIFWIIGFVFRYIVSPLIHLVLIVAVILLALRWIRNWNRRERP
jgi:hypothetical protein